MNDELHRVVDRLIHEYGAERIFLFGSAAQGEPQPHRDIDLLVVKNTHLSFWDRLREVAALCQWHEAFDVLVYTPSEFEEMRVSNPFVRDEVVAKGRLLYERAA